MVHALTGGGAERVASSWANGLSKLGHNVSIMTDLTQGQTYKTSPDVNLIQRSLHKNKKNQTLIQKLIAWMINPFRALAQLYSYIKKESPDIIINVLYLNQFMLLLARLLSGQKIPIIMTDHNAYERPTNIKYLKNQWRNKFFDNRLFDVVTVLTHRDKEILNKKGFKNIKVLHNPLFLKPVKEVPRKENIILAVGRLDAWYVKGFDLLIKAWNNISLNFPEWKLRIVGGGSRESLKFLQDIASKNSQIEFSEYTADIVKEYKRASIFCMPSRYEGWGLVLVEAMSQGCACIACDYKGRQAEIISNKENGLLIPTESVVEIEKALSSLIYDINLRISLQNKAPKSVEIFSEENIAIQWLDIFNF